MIANDSIPHLQLEAQRLQQSLRHTAQGTPAFQQVGHELQRALTAIHEAQQRRFLTDFPR